MASGLRHGELENKIDDLISNTYESFKKFDNVLFLLKSCGPNLCTITLKVGWQRALEKFTSRKVRVYQTNFLMLDTGFRTLVLLMMAVAVFL